MKRTKVDKLQKHHIKYFYDEGIALEDFSGWFIADLNADVVGLPNCQVYLYEQTGEEVEEVTITQMKVGEYFGTKRNINGTDYVYAQIRKGSGFVYPTPGEFIALADLFAIDNVITEEEMRALEEVM